MAYCQSCGVLFKDSLKSCPLCGSDPARERPAASDAGGLDFPNEKPFFQAVLEKEAITADQKRVIFFELSALVFGSAMAAVILADLLINRGFTWSRYAAPPIAYAFLLIGIPLILHRRPWIVFSVLAAGLLAMLFLFDIYNGRLDWFLNYALPITLWAEGLFAGCAAIIAAVKRKGLNVLSITFLFASLFCLGLELILSLNILGRPLLAWSAVVTAAAVPLAGIFFYLHVRIVNRASLKKLFRV